MDPCNDGELGQGHSLFGVLSDKYYLDEDVIDEDKDQENGQLGYKTEEIELRRRKDEDQEEESGQRPR